MPVLADAHIHFFSDRFFRLLSGDPGAACEKLGWDRPPVGASELAALWIAELDKNGVDLAAMIASFPGDEESVLEARAAYPDRLLAFAMVNPLAAVPPSRELDAVCLFPAMHRYPIAGPEAQQVIEGAQVIFVHCGVLTVGIRKKLGLPSMFDMRFSNPMDLHAVAMKYPEKRFIVPHFGAGMFREALMLGDLCPNVYLDTSSTNSWMRYEGLELKDVFRRSLDVLGPERLLFGSDSSFFPRGWNRQIFEAQRAALESIGASESDLQRIFRENLNSLFGAVHSK